MRNTTLSTNTNTQILLDMIKADTSGRLKENLPVRLDLKSGDNILLKVEMGSTAPEVIKTMINNKTQELSLRLNLDENIKLEPNKIYDVAIKVVGQNKNLSLKLVSINNEKPENFAPKTTVFPLNVQKQTIDIPATQLKLSSSIEKMVGELKLPQLAAEKIVSEFKNMEANVSIRNIINPASKDVPQTSNPLDIIKNILQKPNSDISKELPQLLNKAKIIGEVVIKDGMPPLIKTPLGDVMPKLPIKLEAGAKIVLELLDLVKTNPILENKTSNPLLMIIKPLPEPVVQQIMEKIPSGTDKLIQNLVSFIKGSAQKDATLWLGKDVAKQVQISSVDGKEVLAKLTDFISTTVVKENAAWRIIEIPFYNGEIVSSIKVATKKTEDDEEENKNNKKQKQGVRFVVDTNFSQLGSIQFDGYSVSKERRFDLIIRTENSLDEDIVSNIMRIFKTSLHNVDYVGNVKINLHETFIKVFEETESLKDGIFI